MQFARCAQPRRVVNLVVKSNQNACLLDSKRRGIKFSPLQIGEWFDGQTDSGPGVFKYGYVPLSLLGNTVLRIGQKKKMKKKKKKKKERKEKSIRYIGVCSFSTALTLGKSK